jgi:hypothetical protein
MDYSANKAIGESGSLGCSTANEENDIYRNKIESAIFLSTIKKKADLDPTLNGTLCHDVWNRLIERIKADKKS